MTPALSIRLRVFVVTLSSIAASIFVSAALAKTPTGDFAVFKQCPRFTSPADFCLYTVTTGGEVIIGSFRLPLRNPITLQGGYFRNDESGAETFYGALNGETFSKTPQPVPGGLLGILSEASLPRPLKEAFGGLVEKGAAGVSATTELAKPASSIGLSTDNLINEEAVGFSLPVRIHLQNPFLGSECYIGSSSNPLILNLTDGSTRPPTPNKPIAGTFGHYKSEGELRSVGRLEFTELAENVIVDNSFPVPAASGCGGSYSSLIDPVLDTKLGLPSAAGHNTIIQINTVKFVTTAKVLAAEE